MWHAVYQDTRRWACAAEEHTCWNSATYSLSHTRYVVSDISCLHRCSLVKGVFPLSILCFLSIQCWSMTQSCEHSFIIRLHLPKPCGRFYEHQIPTIYTRSNLLRRDLRRIIHSTTYRVKTLLLVARTGGEHLTEKQRARAYSSTLQTLLISCFPAVCMYGRT